MEAKTNCVSCDIEILFSKKDVKPLTKKEKQAIEYRNKGWQEELDRKEVRVGWFKKKEVYYYSYGLIRDMLKSHIIHPIGILKCPICDGEQYITRK